MNAADLAAQLDALATYTRLPTLSDAALLIRKQEATIKALNALKPLELVPDLTAPVYGKEISKAFAQNKFYNELEPE